MPKGLKIIGYGLGDGGIAIKKKKKSVSSLKRPEQLPVQ
jgi:hypothetical protein